MGRYFTRRASIVPEPIYGDEGFLSHTPMLPSLCAPEHEATDTGLLDSNGDTIMRAPNEMGFVWSEDTRTPSAKGE